MTYLTTNFPLASYTIAISLADIELPTSIIASRRYIQEQFDRIPDYTLTNFLASYKAWTAEELTDRSTNIRRVLWIFGCDHRAHVSIPYTSFYEIRATPWNL